MNKVRFGKTELMVSKVAFGGIPIMHLSLSDAASVVRGSIDLGVNFIDTANGYADSEEKIGLAIKGLPRENLVLATKSGARDKKTFLEHVDLSLRRLGVDYIDIYQHHHLSSQEGYDAIFGGGGAFEGMMEAVKAGKVRFPAFSSHSVSMALRVMREGKFAAVQLPFNFVDEEAAEEAIPLAKELDMGFIAMKPLGGGLLDNAKLAFRYLMQYDSIVPDPGIQSLSEIEEIVAIVNAKEVLTATDKEAIEKIRSEMDSVWCHRCEYCMPCPKNIGISNVLNVKSFTKRFPYDVVVKMAGGAFENARGCDGCRACVSKCPYNLDIPKLLKENLEFWDNFK